MVEAGADMTGGRVVQVIPPELGSGVQLVEVLDVTSFDRCWRLVDVGVEIMEGDRLRWQGHLGMLDRPGEWACRSIGSCTPGQYTKAL